jgi:hypothetical protein
MSLYDNWRCIDQLADQQAEYEAKFAALAAQILPTLKLSDYIDEIMHDASWSDELDKAYKASFMTGAECGKLYHDYALQWLADHADKLALAQLQGVEL